MFKRLFCLFVSGTGGTPPTVIGFGGLEGIILLAISSVPPFNNCIYPSCNANGWFLFFKSLAVLLPTKEASSLIGLSINESFSK